MSRLVSWYLRFFTVLVFGSVLFACTGQPIAESEHYHAPGDVVCEPTENLVVCFFSSAVFQAEAKDQKREIRRALMDALELPVEELRKPRYADYQMRPDQWTFSQLLDGYFNSISRIKGRRVMTEWDEFHEALKTPEAIPVLKHWIETVEEAIPSGVGVGGASVACSQPNAANDVGIMCARGENIAVCYFSDVYFQSEGKEERREVVKMGAYGGRKYSWTHNSSSTGLTQQPLPGTSYPSSGEIDLMQYSKAPYSIQDRWDRSVASEQDVTGLLWLTRVKFQ